MIADVVLPLLKTSLFVSLLIGLLMALTPLLQKRYRPKWRYIAWLVIAIRLLIPFQLPLPQAPLQIALPRQPAGEAAAPVQLWEQNELEPEAETPIVLPQNALPAAKPAIAPVQVVGAIWLTGVVVFLLFQAASYQLFLRRFKQSKTETVPDFFKETVWRIGVDMGICRLPEPVITSAIEAPVLIGVLHPRVLFPHTNYMEEDIVFILRHELVHYYRRDMWYKLLLLLANALHWFNPLVYLMTVQAAKDIELACDDDVTRGLDRDARARYGNTILAALPQKRRLEPVFSTHFGSTNQNVRRRLQNLFDMAAKRRGIAALCAVAVCAATISGTVTFGSAAAKENAASTQPDSIPTITDSHNFSIPSIKSGEVVCIGKIELGPDIAYHPTYSVGQGSGSMMALYSEPGITHSAGIGWYQSFGSPSSNIRFTSEKKRTAYIYVGSNINGTTLKNVSGTVERVSLSSESRPAQQSNQSASQAETQSNQSSSQPSESLKNLTFDATSANLVVAVSEDGLFHYDYNPALYELNTSEQSGSKTIVVKAKKQERDYPQMVNIQIPNIAYQQVTCRGIAAGFNMPALDANLEVDISASACALTIPKGYDKTCDLKINASSGVIKLGEDAADYTFSLNANSSSPVLPSGWPAYRYGQAYTYGSGKGMINAEVTASSFVVQVGEKDDRSQSAPTTSAADAFRVERLGLATFLAGDELTADLRWSGDGSVILLYTDKSYTDDEIKASLQRLNGIPKLDYNNIDQPRMKSGAFHFQQSLTSPLTWSALPNAGSYYIYLLYDSDVRGINGYVNVKNDGVTINLLKAEKEVPASKIFQLSSAGQKHIMGSSSFEAKDGETITLSATSNIQGGSVDIFLISPLFEETRITFGGLDKQQTVRLSAGTWAWNCSGTFSSGEIAITAEIE